MPCHAMPSRDGRASSSRCKGTPPTARDVTCRVVTFRNQPLSGTPPHAPA
eukprot:CAMPEP_0168183198 /NCGR_PEP_ID=MMETSP0139_2-20121125/12373_1 /TAXON_ID=44445 /ORGANISM="Pseudo-nitzschia australis, Strain 10249 10 AB" /LENGTH=49 /DNA_ID= /DNA_START= /DNA_END= /DNA_ORIENTATION=